MSAMTGIAAATHQNLNRPAEIAVRASLHAEEEVVHTVLAALSLPRHVQWTVLWTLFVSWGFAVANCLVLNWAPLMWPIVLVAFAVHAVFVLTRPARHDKGTPLVFSWHNEPSYLWLATRAILITAHYVAIGIIFYTTEERLIGPPGQQQDASFGGTRACDDGNGTCRWTIVDALYFVVQTLTTVGYGDMPCPASTRQFTTMFSLVSMVMLTLILYVVQLAPLSQLVFLVIGKKRIKTMSSSLEQSSPSSRIVIEGVLMYALFLIFHSLSAFIFRHVEGWVYADAFYHCVITATTVGYGDMNIATQGGKAFAVVHMMWSSIYLAIVLNRVKDIAGTIQAERNFEQSKALMLNADIVKMMDHHGIGSISKVDFMRGMLIELNLAEARTIDEIVRRFDALDNDSSGYIDRQEALEKDGRRRSTLARTQYVPAQQTPDKAQTGQAGTRPRPLGRYKSVAGAMKPVNNALPLVGALGSAYILFFWFNSMATHLMTLGAMMQLVAAASEYVISKEPHHQTYYLMAALSITAVLLNIYAATWFVVAIVDEQQLWHFDPLAARFSPQIDRAYGFSVAILAFGHWQWSVVNVTMIVIDVTNTLVVARFAILCLRCAAVLKVEVSRHRDTQVI